MPRISTFRLTKTAIDSLPAGKDAVYFDSRLAGFGIRTKPNGKKTYLLQYVNREGRERRYSIGQHGGLTLEDARDIAQKLIGRIANGEDPTEERAAKREAETLTDLWRIYSAAVQLGIDEPKKAVIWGRGGRPKRASSLKSDQSMFKRHVGPLLGHRKVKDLLRKDITRFMNDVTVGKTARFEKTKPRGRARVTGGAGIATRCLGLIGSLLGYAITMGIIEANPSTGIRRTPTKRRKVRLNPEQYIALGEALRVSEDLGEAWQAIEAIWVLALTGCRKSEITMLKPSEVDPQGSVLRLAETKSGENIRPIGSAAMKILQPRIGNYNYIFCGAYDEETFFKGLPNVWQRVMSRVDPNAKMPHLTLHGLRHAYASQAADLGFGIPTIKELLGHSAGSDVTAGYVHFLDKLLIAAADRIAGTIYNYMSGAATGLTEQSMADDDIGASDSALWQATQGGQLVSIQEAAVMLGVGRPTIERLIEKGSLEATTFGKQRRLDVTEVLTYRRLNPANKPPLVDKLEGKEAKGALLSPEEAAMVLRVGRPTVMKLIADGTFNAVKVGERFRLPAVEVLAYRESHIGRRGNVDFSTVCS